MLLTEKRINKMHYTNIKTLSDNTEQLTLTNIKNSRINHKTKGWIDFTINNNNSIQEIASLICKRKNTLNRLINGLYRLKYNWSYDRFIFNGSRWVYMAGQDEQTELKALRKTLYNI
jgi:hypothetical protein